MCILEKEKKPNKRKYWWKLGSSWPVLCFPEFFSWLRHIWSLSRGAEGSCGTLVDRVAKFSQPWHKFEEQRGNDDHLKRTYNAGDFCFSKAQMGMADWLHWFIFYSSYHTNGTGPNGPQWSGNVLCHMCTWSWSVEMHWVTVPVSEWLDIDGIRDDANDPLFSLPPWVLSELFLLRVLTSAIEHSSYNKWLLTVLIHSRNR